MILLATGVGISLVSTQETYLEAETVDNWDVYPSILEPQNSTFYGRLMHVGMWFKLNLSSSEGPVEVTVSYTREQDTKVPIFDQTGSSFTEEVPISRISTYWVDIKNENSFAVTLDGSILVQQPETKHRTVYPYAIPGVLLIVGSTGALIFGILKNPKRPSRSKERKTTKN